MIILVPSPQIEEWMTNVVVTGAIQLAQKNFLVLMISITSYHVQAIGEQRLPFELSWNGEDVKVLGS